MDIKSVAAIQMKHEGRISRVEQRTDDLGKLYAKHSNRHFQVTLIVITQLLVTIGGLIAVCIKF